MQKVWKIKRKPTVPKTKYLTFFTFQNKINFVAKKACQKRLWNYQLPLFISCICIISQCFLAIFRKKTFASTLAISCDASAEYVLNGELIKWFKMEMEIMSLKKIIVIISNTLVS